MHTSSDHTAPYVAPYVAPAVPRVDGLAIAAMVLGICGLFLGFIYTIPCVLAIVFAVLVGRRRAWAARGLLICAAACALFCVLATLASPVALVPAVAAIATISCLRRPEVRAWLTREPPA